MSNNQVRFLIRVCLYFIFLLSGFNSKAQQKLFKIDTLQYQGEGTRLINFVILGDGYTEDELVYYREDAQRFVDYFFKTEPFRQYIDYFNVFLIETISEESGAIHACKAKDCPHGLVKMTDLPARYNRFGRNVEVPFSQPKTIFGSSFDSGGLHRLVIAKNSKLVEKVLKDHIPNYTQSIILVNSPYYGGSGGGFPTATVNIQSNDIAVHELGHSFGKLGDEYWAGNQYAIEAPNRTQVADPDSVCWKDWLGIGGVGIYSYGKSGSKAQWFRPHEFCKMQYLHAPFCPVCQEQLVHVITTKASPILKVKPSATEKVQMDKTTLFGLRLAKPVPNTLQVKWYLNEQLIAVNQDSIFVAPGLLSSGEHTLRATVQDTTSLIRTTSYKNNIQDITWTMVVTGEIPLDTPTLTWGDSLETCFNGQQTIAIQRPQAGVVYNWYADQNSKNPIQQSAYFVTPRLTQDRIYYVEAQAEEKFSQRIPVYIRILPEIPRPAVAIKHNNKQQTVTISITDLHDDRFRYVWQSAEGKTIRGIENKEKQNNNMSVVLKKKGIPFTVYLTRINKETTCSSERTEIVVK